MRERASGADNAALGRSGGERAFIDLHCHTRASFDSLALPAAVVRAAAARGLTHIAITDHDRIEGALEAREAAGRLAEAGDGGIDVLVGEEIRTADGDLIAVFLERAIPAGLSAPEAVAAIREQGGLVGLPHPFDRFRGSLGRASGAGGEAGRMAGIVARVDWIETYNARLVGRGNERAAELAREARRPGVAVSDAHSVMEVGVAYSILEGDPATPAGLRAALNGASLVTGRASYAARAITPIAKLVQRARGNGRVEPPPSSGAGPDRAPRS